MADHQCTINKDHHKEEVAGVEEDLANLEAEECHQAEDFKEDFIGVQDRSKKHNALVDAHVARDLYLKLEAGRPHSNGSSTH